MFQINATDASSQITVAVARDSHRAGCLSVIDYRQIKKYDFTIGGSNMNIYLAVITTILVTTQVVRLVQNTINLKRQKQILDKQLEGLDEVTDDDLTIRRKADKMIVKYLESKGVSVDE